MFCGGPTTTSTKKIVMLSGYGDSRKGTERLRAEDATRGFATMNERTFIAEDGDRKGLTTV